MLWCLHLSVLQQSFLQFIFTLIFFAYTAFPSFEFSIRVLVIVKRYIPAQIPQSYFKCIITSKCLPWVTVLFDKRFSSVSCAALVYQGWLSIWKHSQSAVWSLTWFSISSVQALIIWEMYFHTIKRLHYLDTRVSKYIQNPIKANADSYYKYKRYLN